MTLAEQADAATTRDALAAMARLRGLCADLSDFQPVSVPEPTPSVTDPTGGTVQAVAEALIEREADR